MKLVASSSDCRAVKWCNRPECLDTLPTTTNSLQRTQHLAQRRRSRTTLTAIGSCIVICQPASQPKDFPRVGTYRPVREGDVPTIRRRNGIGSPNRLHQICAHLSFEIDIVKHTAIGIS